jgi:hypothetical protein
MLVKVKDKTTMKHLRELYPEENGKNIIHMINSAIIDKDEQLLIEPGVYEDVMIGGYEYVVMCSIEKNDVGALLTIEEMHLRI